MNTGISDSYRYSHIIFILLLVIIPLAVYWQCTSFDFVWDDRNPNLIENKYLQDPTYENIIHFWTKPYAQMYIPMSYTAWAGIKELGKLCPFGQSEDGFNPFIFHLLNVLLHILNGILIFKILHLFIQKNLPSFLGALIFLLHPLQVETVVWITEFRGLLAAFFGFGSLYLLIKNEILITKGVPTRCIRIGYINSLILFLFGMLSKPSVVVIPAIGFLCYLLYFKHSFWYSFKKFIPYVIVTIPFIILVRFTQPSSYHTELAPLWSRLFIWMDTINFYLLKTVVPFPLIATYTRTFQTLLPKFWFYIEWLIPLLLVFFAVKAYKKYPLILLGILIFIVGFLPVSGLIPFVFQKWSNVADRYVYISMLGVGLIIAWLLKTFKKKFLWIIIICIISCYALITCLVQIPVWKNSLTLWSHALTYGKPNTYAYNNRGIAYQKIGEYELALNDFKKSIILNSLHTKSYYNIGIVYAENEKPDSALAYFNKAIDKSNTYVDAFLNRGVAYHNLKRYDEALRDFDYIIDIHPNDEMAYSNRGITNLELEKYTDAIRDFSKAIILNPARAQTYYLRGKTKKLMGDKKDALQDLTTALNLQPDLIDALVKRAILYEENGNLDAAFIDAQKAYNLDNENVDSSVIIGDLLTKRGNFSDAISFYSHALSLDPSNASIYQKRAVAYYFLGNYGESEHDIIKAEQLGAKIPASFIKSLKNEL